VKKGIKILLAIGLMVTIATPALAEFKFNGYFRTMGYSQEKKAESSSATDIKNTDGDSQQFILQRLRAKLTYSLNDNVSVVYYGEVDTDWGLESKGSIGGGGKFGADGVNVETKNVYLDMKFDDSEVRLGIQGVGDHVDGAVVVADMAALVASHSFGDTTLKGIYSKFDEGDTSNWDGEDFYAVIVDHKVNDNLKIAGGVYYLDDNDAESTSTGFTASTSQDPAFAGDAISDTESTASDYATKEIFFYGPRVAYVQDNFTVDGFLVFQKGELEYDNAAKLAFGSTDSDIEGFLGSLKGTMKIEGGDLNLRFLYGSEDDDAKDQGAWQGDLDQYAFVNENQMIMLIDKNITNAGKQQYAVNDALKQGYGLMALVASGNHKLPEDAYFKWGAGYYLAVDEERNNTNAAKPGSNTLVTRGSDRRKGDTIGYEVAARVGKKFFDKVDVSLNAAYAGFGDFYDNTVQKTATTVDDPSDIFRTYVMVNVPF
jgi:hypothetical protein